MPDLALLLLRIAAGGMMLFGHGWPKFISFGERAASFPDPFGLGSSFSLGLAVFAEVLCAVALVLGVGTRVAALPLLVTMLVAAFAVHGADPFAKKELALLYAAAYGTLFLSGGGRWSLVNGRSISWLQRWS